MSEARSTAPIDWSEAAAALREAMPEFLRRPLGGHVELWQVVGVAAAAGIAWLLAAVVVRGLVALLRRVTRRTTTTFDDELATRLVSPARLLVGSGVSRPLLALLALPPDAAHWTATVARELSIGAVIWGVWRAVNLTLAHLSVSAWATSRPGAKSLIGLGGSLGRLAVLGVGVITLLGELDYPVTSIIAGLGLGGLAIALAAQKTVENLFGAFSLAFDQPFRVGDFVRVEDFVGVVEHIGMRATRFRTLDRTVISIPNGKLAEARLETFAARDRIRLACTLGLTYDTTGTQMREVLTNLEALLRRHPKIWPDAVVVRFKELGASSLDIEVMAWFQTSDWGEFQQIRQDLLLDFMAVVERAGSSFAFPTQTIHLPAPVRGAPSN